MGAHVPLAVIGQASPVTTRRGGWGFQGGQRGYARCFDALATGRYRFVNLAMARKEASSAIPRGSANVTNWHEPGTGRTQAPPNRMVFTDR